MIIDDAALYRAAGISAGVALVALIAAGITIALFFGGAGDVFGPINDVFTAVTAIALILPIVAVDRLAGAQVGGWLRVVTIAAIGGAILIAVGQLLLVVGVINLEASFVTGGVGIIPVGIWIVTLVALAIPLEVLPSSIGWLALAAIGLVVVGSIITVITTGLPAWVAWIAVAGALVLWLASVSASLLDRAVA